MPEKASSITLKGLQDPLEAIDLPELPFRGAQNGPLVVAV